MAASKPISWLYLKKTSLFSLNNNFGTFNSCSGLFPFRHTTLSYYVRLCKIHHCPSESKYSRIESSRPPHMHKALHTHFECKYSPVKSLQPPDVDKNIVRDHSSVPAKMLVKLPTYIGFAENQLSQSVLSFTNLPQFIGYLYNDNPFGLL